MAPACEREGGGAPSGPVLLCYFRLADRRPVERLLDVRLRVVPVERLRVLLLRPPRDMLPALACCARVPPRVLRARAETPPRDDERLLVDRLRVLVERPLGERLRVLLARLRVAPPARLPAVRRRVPSG